jgi:4-carboxymuconolactone decarboxylase
MDEAERHAAGMKVRRTILGNAHVDRSVASQSDLNAEFQDLIVRYAWGEIWTRPGLDHRTRRLLVLSTTAAMGRWEEFRLHVRAGLEGGLALDDIEEALLQLAVYAGVPAGNTAFHIVEDVLGQLGIKQGK